MPDDFYTVFQREEDRNDWDVKKNEYNFKDHPVSLCHVPGNAKLIAVTPELYSLYRQLEQYFYSMSSNLTLNFDDIEKQVLKIKKKLARLDEKI